MTTVDKPTVRKSEKIICTIPLPAEVNRFVLISRKLAEAFPGCYIRNGVDCYEVFESDTEPVKKDK